MNINNDKDFNFMIDYLFNHFLLNDFNPYDVYEMTSQQVGSLFREIYN